jgi:hypothetical protein
MRGCAGGTHEGGVDKHTPESQELSEGSSDAVKRHEGTGVDPVAEPESIGIGRDSSEVDDDEKDEETDNGDNFDLGTITGQ